MNWKFKVVRFDAGKLNFRKIAECNGKNFLLEESKIGRKARITIKCVEGVLEVCSAPDISELQSAWQLCSEVKLVFDEKGRLSQDSVSQALQQAPTTFTTIPSLAVPAGASGSPPPNVSSDPSSDGAATIYGITPRSTNSESSSQSASMDLAATLSGGSLIIPSTSNYSLSSTTTSASAAAVPATGGSLRLNFDSAVPVFFPDLLETLPRLPLPLPLPHPLQDSARSATSTSSASRSALPVQVSSTLQIPATDDDGSRNGSDLGSKQPTTTIETDLCIPVPTVGALRADSSESPSSELTPNALENLPSGNSTESPPPNGGSPFIARIEKQPTGLIRGRNSMRKPRSPLVQFLKKHCSSTVVSPTTFAFEASETAGESTSTTRLIRRASLGCMPSASSPPSAMGFSSLVASPPTPSTGVITPTVAAVPQRNLVLQLNRPMRPSTAKVPQKQLTSHRRACSNDSLDEVETSEPAFPRCITDGICYSAGSPLRLRETFDSNRREEIFQADEETLLASNFLSVCATMFTELLDSDRRTKHLDPTVLAQVSVVTLYLLVLRLCPWSWFVVFCIPGIIYVWAVLSFSRHHSMS